MNATLADVCRRSGLSSATVSRVINGSSLVRKETRARVVRAMRALDYHPSHAAQTLAKRRTNTLGVLYPYMASGFFADILRGIAEIAADSGYQVLTLFAHRDAQGLDRIGSFTAKGRVDGLIVLNLDFPDSVVRSLAGRGVPTVLLDRPVPGSGLTTVGIDNAAGARALMAHMLEHGHEDVLVLGGPSDSHDGNARWRGCVQAARRRGMPLAPTRRLCGDFREETGAAAMARWLDEGHPPPRVLVALNDVMALGAWDVLKRRGLRVPEDVALAGFDDGETARHVGLTTVRVPLCEMGREACRLALARLHGETPPERVVVPAELVIRRSCGCGGPLP
ncbi:MAG: LacI family DNA-binding transcriptional regulator [Kiritimatiellae bacterium]|nr:LacI family DNA-binding transcriptional regulator [Kiritimatiellia bacterium]